MTLDSYLPILLFMAVGTAVGVVPQVLGYVLGPSRPGSAKNSAYECGFEAFGDALIIYRVMRQRLKLAGSKLSPESALAELRRIQRHSVSIDSATPVHGVSTVHPQQADVLAALNIKKPTNDAQMSLL